MLVKLNKKKGPWAISTGKGKPLTLIPGVNEVASSVWENVKNHPTVKERLENGMLELLQSSSEDKKEDKKEADSLGDLFAKDAKALVESTHHAPTLRKWLEDESRSSVEKALKSKLEELEKEREDSENSQE